MRLPSPFVPIFWDGSFQLIRFGFGAGPAAIGLTTACPKQNLSAPKWFSNT